VRALAALMVETRSCHKNLGNSVRFTHWTHLLIGLSAQDVWDLQLSGGRLSRMLLSSTAASVGARTLRPHVRDDEESRTHF
jgi:hypothetical protein